MALLPTGSILYSDVNINGVNYNTATFTGSTITQQTWTHVCLVVTPSMLIQYINGAVVGYQYTHINGVITNVASTSAPICIMYLGANSTGTQPFKGYIDDVRIYNRALSGDQIKQLYLNNATTTTPHPTYLLPRSYTYTTPTIQPNSWEKVSVTIPGDTTGHWMTNSDDGLTLSLALGATSLYSTSNYTTVSSGNSVSLWNNYPEYTASNLQIYGASSNNFLSSVANSIYVTGVQLEKGTVSTPYEFRPFATELQLVNGGSIGKLDAKSTTSGTSVTFTVPTWAKEIIVMLNGVSLSGSNGLHVQVGSGGVATTTGYLSYCTVQTSSTASGTLTTGFAIYASAAGQTHYISMRIQNISGTTWLASHTGGMVNSTTYYSSTGGGSVTLAGLLDTVVVKPTGSDTFDAGFVNVMFQ